MVSRFLKNKLLPSLVFHSHRKSLPFSRETLRLTFIKRCSRKSLTLDSLRITSSGKRRSIDWWESLSFAGWPSCALRCASRRQRFICRWPIVTNSSRWPSVCMGLKNSSWLGWPPSTSHPRLRKYLCPQSRSSLRVRITPHQCVAFVWWSATWWTCSPSACTLSPW